MIYCPYTNTDIEKSLSSSEHIIPLALGGLNGFEIPVCKEFNSHIGSKIDGTLANDFLIQMKRNEHDVRGHSKKRPVFVAKKSINTDTNQPIQAAFDRTEGLKIWCPITKKYLNEVGSFSTKIELSLDIDTQFVAKTALSAGYFTYGDLFRYKVKHEELRFIMYTPPKEMGDKIHSIETRADSRFSEDKNENLRIFRAVCRKLHDSSIVGLVPTSGSLAIFVGILGYYMGMVNVPADTKDFPNEGDYHWGHVICVQQGLLKRASFRRTLEKFVGITTT
jgi:hypothetical protein